MFKIGGKVRYRPDGTPQAIAAVPTFGYKSHISIECRYGFIREATVISASDADGRQLKRLLTTGNTSSEVWPPLSVVLRKRLPGKGHRVPLAAQ